MCPDLLKNGKHTCQLPHLNNDTNAPHSLTNGLDSLTTHLYVNLDDCLAMEWPDVEAVIHTTLLRISYVFDHNHIYLSMYGCDASLCLGMWLVVAWLGPSLITGKIADISASFSWPSLSVFLRASWDGLQHWPIAFTNQQC